MTFIDNKKIFTFSDFSNKSFSLLVDKLNKSNDCFPIKRSSESELVMYYMSTYMYNKIIGTIGILSFVTDVTEVTDDYLTDNFILAYNRLDSKTFIKIKNTKPYVNGSVKYEPTTSGYFMHKELYDMVIQEFESVESNYSGWTMEYNTIPVQGSFDLILNEEPITISYNDSISEIQSKVASISNKILVSGEFPKYNLSMVDISDEPLSENSTLVNSAGHDVTVLFRKL